MSNILENNNLISASQFVYIAGNNAVDAIYKLVEEIMEKFEDKENYRVLITRDTDLP